ncbi:MAG: hypothetical protein ACHQRM_10435, partial [Bacteroidia bacterium]
MKAFLLSAQPVVSFQKHYNFGGTDEGYCVEQTIDHGYIITGRLTNGGGDSKIVLQKVDSSGQTQWYKVFGGPYDNIAYSVKQTTDGGYILAGYTSNSSYAQFVYLIKTDGNGDTLWTKRNLTPHIPTVPSVYGAIGYYVAQTNDGGYALTARYVDSDSTGVIMFIKTNSSGDTLWTKKLKKSFGLVGGCFQQSADSTYIIAGKAWTAISPSNTYNILILKLNPVGDTIWTKLLHTTTNNETVYSIQKTTDGGYFLSGVIAFTSTLKTDAYIVKTNSTGDTLWTRKIGGSGNDGVQSGQQTSDGGYVMVGLTTSYGAGADDVYLVKTDNSGNVSWFKTFGGVNNDYGDFVQQTKDHGYIISGFTASFGSGDIYLIKTDSTGYAIATGINELHSMNSVLIYPNPMESSAEIILNHKFDGTCLFEVFDPLGRCVKRIEGIKEQQFTFLR